MKITPFILHENQYYQEQSEKDLIVLHHTVSAGDAQDVVDYWNSNVEMIGTSYIVDKDGSVYQTFKEDTCWAWHIGGEKQLGCSYLEAVKLNQRSIGIELVSMGSLIYKNGEYIDAYNRPFKGKVVVFNKPYRGFVAAEAYTEAQLESTYELCNFLFGKHKKIPRDIPNNPEELNKFFLTYTGIVSHTTLRKDKTDVHPCFPYDMLRERCQLHLDS